MTLNRSCVRSWPQRYRSPPCRSARQWSLPARCTAGSSSAPERPIWRRRFNQWTFVDADDLGDLTVRAATATTPGHEVVYAAQPDNLRGEPLADMIAQVYGDHSLPVRDLERPDSGAINIAKARRLFGWEPRTALAAR